MCKYAVVTNYSLDEYKKFEKLAEVEGRKALARKKLAEYQNNPNLDCREYYLGMWEREVKKLEGGKK